MSFLVSNSGRWVEMTGAVWLVYELTGSPLLLGVLGIVRSAGFLAVGPIAGVLADRSDQRRVLQMSQALHLIGSLTIGALVATGRIELWHIYVQAGFSQALVAVDGAVRQALFPRLVPHERLSEAVTVDSAAPRIATLVGPATGGLAIGTLGVAAPFFLCAACIPVVSVALLLMRVRARSTPAVAGSVRGDLLDGLRHMARDPVIAGLLRLEVIYALFAMNAVMITIVGRGELGVGPEQLGLLLASPGAGALLGIVYLLVAGPAERQGRLVIEWTIAYAACLLGFAVVREYAVAILLLFACGTFDVLVSITRKSVLQLATPGRLRGRVMGNMRLVSVGMNPLAQTQSGALSSAVGAPIALAVAAGIFVVGAIGTARSNEALWRFVRRDVRPVPELAGSSEV